MPNKVKVHSWRLMRNGLAVGSELSRRKIKPGIWCVACGREESLAHRFWMCPHSQCFWKDLSERRGSPASYPPGDTQSSVEVGRWLAQWISKAGDKQREMMMQGVYGLWLARNNARDGKRIQSPHEISCSVSRLMDEWYEVVQRRLRAIERPPSEKWVPPEQGWILANVDGTVSKNGSEGGGGVLLRDHDGAFRGAATQFFPNDSNPEFVELKACRRALQLGRDLGVSKIHVEMDCNQA